MARPRKHYSPQEKVSILRRHLLDQVSISDLCDEFGLAPNVFYRWQKEFFENGAAAFEPKPKGRKKKQESIQSQKMEALEAKLVRKNEVLSELMEAHISLKKELGEL
jgi:transposase-like protein